ncbi:MAG: hypothetical protein HY952_10880, partial [Elusimicrobia bacterium]|nr:hypothetical protein [Elusimicrobiota bacterium]
MNYTKLLKKAFRALAGGALMAAALGGLIHAASTIDNGTTGFSNQPKIVQNPVGYWAFYESGGTAVCSFSEDGVNWDLAQPIFAQADQDKLNPQVSIWYVAASSEVFIAASPNFDGTSTVPAPVGMAKASLTAKGVPAFTTRRDAQIAPNLGGRVYYPAGYDSVSLIYHPAAPAGSRLIVAAHGFNGSRNRATFRIFREDTLAVTGTDGGDGSDNPNASGSYYYHPVILPSASDKFVIIFNANGSLKWMEANTGGTNIYTNQTLDNSQPNTNES